MTVSDMWFKPKRFGHGAKPANWKGWVATFVFLAAILVSTMALLTASALPKNSQTIAATAVLVVVDLALATGFIILTRIKTDGA